MPIAGAKMRCAYLRRKILEKLIPYWFNDKLRIASAYGTAWNAEMNAFEIQTEFIKGRHVLLHHPYSKKGGDELKNLVDNLTVPLQEKLNEFGFDGLVWQAGLGNPTAISNFMLHDDGNWVWIDAESGVPALFPLNPMALIKFYIPKTIQYRSPMFDDVNVKKLKAYLNLHKIQLQDNIGSTDYQQLLGEVADFYYRHFYLWYPKELFRIAILIFQFTFQRLPIRAFNKLKNFPYRTILSNTYGFIFSEHRRKKIVENYVFGRIASWAKRQQLSGDHAALLRDQLAHESSTPYFTDFMVVIALKPVIKASQVFGLQALYAMGLIDEVGLGTG